MWAYLLLAEHCSGLLLSCCCLEWSASPSAFRDDGAVSALGPPSHFAQTLIFGTQAELRSWGQETDVSGLIFLETRGAFAFVASCRRSLSLSIRNSALGNRLSLRNGTSPIFPAAVCILGIHLVVPLSVQPREGRIDKPSERDHRGRRRCRNEEGTEH